MAVSTCVIYNPAAGRGRAGRLLESVRQRSGHAVDFKPTAGPRHAVELAKEAVSQGFGRIVAAGGDGTVHEVANGVLETVADVIFSVIPVGSSNDYAYALGLTRWWADGGDPGQLVAMRADVGVVRYGGRERFFVNGVGVGFNGFVDREAAAIRFLRGLPLYGLAVLRALVWHFDAPPMRVEFDAVKHVGPTLALSVSLGVREGGFPLFRGARLDDGEFDTLHVGPIRRWELLRYFPAMITGNIPTNHPRIRSARCLRAFLSSDRPLCAHADGELICVPEDDVRELSIKLLPARLLVESYRWSPGTKRPAGPAPGGPD